MSTTIRKVRSEKRPERRGVTGVLAMMFLILFSSLAVAMAVMSKGNLRAAETHARVSRAQSAVDTGLLIAESRLSEAASRFVVARGLIDAEYAGQLWAGTYGLTPRVEVLPAPDGRVEANTPVGIADIIRMHHEADADADPIETITLSDPPTGWVRGDPIAIERDGSGDGVNLAQIDYAPPDGAGRVRVIVTGYEWDWLRNRWILRSAQQLFSITKTMEHAIISPSRVMLGRNVQVNGPLGVRYNSQALDTLDGPPLVSLSDFAGLSTELTAKIEALHTAIAADDVDGDGRLRLNHPTESRSIGTLNQRDFNNDSAADNAFRDYTRDDAIDEFDVFLKHYDTIAGDNQRKVVLSAVLKSGTPNWSNASEFAVDDALGLLIDSANPDRNGNGKWNGRIVSGGWDFSTFPDNNGDGLLNSDDIDQDDITLGYRDGALDYKDLYAKVRGSVYFKAARADWESSRDDFGVALGDYQQLVEGTIRPDAGEQPVKFQATDAEVPNITQESFAEAAQIMGEFSEGAGVDADVFSEVIAPQLNAEWIVESTPYGSPTPADWYRRPVYRDLTFRNTTIPRGTNALFINCTFVGVTRIMTWVDNDHESFTFYGEQVRDVTTGQLEQKYPLSTESTVALDTRWCDFLDCSSLDPPDPFRADIDGDGDLEDCVDSKLVSNNIRFESCVFIGSIVADKPEVFTHVRNKLQFTGGTKFVDKHPTEPNNPAYLLDSDEQAITKTSSMMAPHYSVDIGTNNSPQTQDISLKGAIIAGVLDVRGNTNITGALLLTFNPVYGQAPLAVYGDPAGNPESFNVTLGYFGPDDGDQEGIDLSSLRDLDNNGTLDVGWDSARDETGALVLLGTTPEEEEWFDGIPDDDATEGTHIRRAIPFNGFGGITLNLDRSMTLPDGLSSPISITPIRTTYLEGQIVTGHSVHSQED